MTFNPPLLMRNRHVQSILSSTAPRKRLLWRRHSDLFRQSEDVILDCTEGVRLHGLYIPKSGGQDSLVILIHGWEGCAESNYMLSATAALHNRGHSIFRLHLRDHGPSHHLNRDLFNSTRIEEVISAIEQIQARFPSQPTYLAGFSLGGNFSLRIAANAASRAIDLQKVVAICPVLEPPATMAALNRDRFIYQPYFIYKWKRSLAKKLELFPELGYGDQFQKMRTLQQMNEYFVPNYTPFATDQEYLKAYAITGDRLSSLAFPCHLIMSSDDPIIPLSGLDRIARPENLVVERIQGGGHCGFIKNYRLESWIDDRLCQLFDGV